MDETAATDSLFEDKLSSLWMFELKTKKSDSTSHHVCVSSRVNENIQFAYRLDSLFLISQATIWLLKSGQLPSVTEGELSVPALLPLAQRGLPQSERPESTVSFGELQFRSIFIVWFAWSIIGLASSSGSSSGLIGKSCSTFNAALLLPPWLYGFW